ESQRQAPGRRSGMCGIVGTAGTRPAPEARREALALLAHRGPDGGGEWEAADGEVWLGHRRLSIIDLTERGRQPMAAYGGRLQITFNGEIYNYPALRRELEAAGSRFRTD